MKDNHLINLKNITVSFDDEEPVLKDISLYIRDNEFITFLGPSGCGKTTTLRIIGGFVEPNEGDVFFEGKKIRSNCFKCSDNSTPPHYLSWNLVEGEPFTFHKPECFGIMTFVK